MPARTEAPALPATEGEVLVVSQIPYLRELGERHVYRVALTYLAVAWVVIEVAGEMLPALHVPDWSTTLVTALALLGFPIALVLAWAFDITPEGVRRTRTSRPERVGAGAPPDAAPVEADPRAVAVLPFPDRSPEGGYQFLGDGIAEELVNSLARLGGLRVVARTSAFAFRGGTADVREIARRLGVGSVVEGSLLVTGDRLRLTIQLVDARNGHVTWSERYDRRFDDVLVIQEEMARAVVGALYGGLAASGVAVGAGPPEGAPLLLQTTTDVEAYRLYLRGRQCWAERSPVSLRKALEFFEQATTRDPGFAHAFAGLADCHAILLDHALVPPETALPAARRAAEQALRLGPQLAEAHTSIALVRQLEWDWPGAEAGFRAAIALNPGYAMAHQRRALLLAWLGRLEESRAAIDRALHLDPLSPATAATCAWVAYYGGEPEAAIGRARAALGEYPDLASARIVLALALLQAARPEEATRELERLAEGAGPSGGAAALLAHARARTGDLAGARALLDEPSVASAPPYYRAIALLGVAEPEAAMRELKRAEEQRSPQLGHLLADPIFADIRRRPDFRALLARVGLTPPARARLAATGDLP